MRNRMLTTLLATTALTLFAGCKGEEAPPKQLGLQWDQAVVEERRKGDFFADPELGITVTEFPYNFAEFKGVLTNRTQSLVGVVTIDGMGKHSIKVETTVEALDAVPNEPFEPDKLSVEITDLDLKTNRGIVLSQASTYVQIFDDIESNPRAALLIQLFENGEFYLGAADSNMDQTVQSAKAASDVVAKDKRFSGASPWVIAMAFALGQYDGRPLCADPTNCPMPPPVCDKLAGLCDCIICAKLGVSDCFACP